MFKTKILSGALIFSAVAISAAQTTNEYPGTPVPGPNAISLNHGSSGVHSVYQTKNGDVIVAVGGGLNTPWALNHVLVLRRTIVGGKPVWTTKAEVLSLGILPFGMAPLIQATVRSRD